MLYARAQWRRGARPVTTSASYSPFTPLMMSSIERPCEPAQIRPTGSCQHFIRVVHRRVASTRRARVAPMCVSDGFGHSHGSARRVWQNITCRMFWVFKSLAGISHAGQCIWLPTTNNDNSNSSDCSGGATKTSTKEAFGGGTCVTKFLLFDNYFVVQRSIFICAGAVCASTRHTIQTQKKIITDISLAWIKVYSIARMFIRIISIVLVGSVWWWSALFRIYTPTEWPSWAQPTRKQCKHKHKYVPVHTIMMMINKNRRW